jgi:GDP/UDP-N,N'-diacetylbacillosamine 2-epimerase (hydrolysing)
MKRIVILTGTRAEFGILTPLIEDLSKEKGLDVSLIVTAMHLVKDFGYTMKDIKSRRFKIASVVPSMTTNDTELGMVESMGNCISRLGKALKQASPDILVLLGDRSEMLAGAIAANLMNIPVAHIHGGDTSGNVDNVLRDAITKLSHIHFPATPRSASKILSMNEERWRVHVVGSLSIDAIRTHKMVTAKTIYKKYGLDPKKGLILVVQHPVTYEPQQAVKQIDATLAAIKQLKKQTVIIYPNADAGGRRMISRINSVRKLPFIRIVKSLPREEYLTLLSMADVLIGNSSSGIIEGPAFKVPVINLGTRQCNRERSKNVIDTGHDPTAIVNAVKYVMTDRSFGKGLGKLKNIYGTGHASEKIIKVLRKVPLNERLLVKR